MAPGRNLAEPFYRIRQSGPFPVTSRRAAEAKGSCYTKFRPGDMFFNLSIAGYLKTIAGDTEYGPEDGGHSPSPVPIWGSTHESAQNRI